LIPAISEDFEIEFENEEIASRDFAIASDQKSIRGMVEDLAEVKQAIFFILNTERYNYIIYPWSYGIELVDLIGKNINFVIPEVERRIKEALLQDSRITDVFNFGFNKVKTKLTVSFTARTIFGDVQAERVVDI